MSRTLKPKVADSSPSWTSPEAMLNEAVCNELNALIDKCVAPITDLRTAAKAHGLRLKIETNSDGSFDIGFVRVI